MHDAGVAGRRQGCGKPRRELADERLLARRVVLPERREALQLALEIAGGTAEIGQARALDVDRVQLDEGVDEVVAGRTACVGARERAGQLLGHDMPAQLFHDVEGDAEHVGFGTDGEDARHARAVVQRSQHARLAQHVVRRRRQRRARRPTQHHAPLAALEEERRVRVARPDACRCEDTRAEAVRVQPGLEGPPHEERRQRQCRRLLGRVDDVDRAGHAWRRRTARRAIDQRCVSLGPS